MADVARPLPARASVDGRRLAKEYRDALAPGRHRAATTHGHRAPAAALLLRDPVVGVRDERRLTPHFGLWELIQTDVREAAALQTFPRYVPCALPLLALRLELFRAAVGTFVHIAANGGYRSPRHGSDRQRDAALLGHGGQHLPHRRRVSRRRARRSSATPTIARRVLPGVGRARSARRAGGRRSSAPRHRLRGVGAARRAGDVTRGFDASA